MPHRHLDELEPECPVPAYIIERNERAAERQGEDLVGERARAAALELKSEAAASLLEPGNTVALEEAVCEAAPEIARAVQSANLARSPKLDRLLCELIWTEVEREGRIALSRLLVEREGFGLGRCREACRLDQPMTPWVLG